MISDTWRRQLEKTHPDLLLTFLTIENRFQRRTGKRRIKITDCKRFLRNSRTVVGPVHPVVAVALTRLALLQYWRQHHSKAQGSLNQSLEIWKRCSPQDEKELHFIQGIRMAMECQNFHLSN